MSQNKGSSRFKNYEKPQVEERFDYADLVRRQIERCLMLSMDDVGFENAVQALEALLPDDLKDETYTSELNDSNYTIEKFEYNYTGPLRVGTKKKPFMEKDPKRSYGNKRVPIPYIKDDDGNDVIDWSNPHIISPRLVEEYHVDWTRRFQAVFNQFYRLGLAVRRVSRG